MANYNNSVTVTKTTLVYPSKPALTQPNCTLIKLSNLDRKCPSLMYLVFFYKKPPHYLSNEGNVFFRDLKKGLEETLSIWYPAAGRLYLDDESGRLDIECNNCGALFVEAFTQVQISELGELSNADCNFLEKLVFRPPMSSSDRLDEMPLVVVQLPNFLSSVQQMHTPEFAGNSLFVDLLTNIHNHKVTEFGCGGYAIGVGTSHALFDGHANFNFMSAWACKTAGREENQVEPVHERESLNLLSPGHGDLSNAPPTTKVIAFDHLRQLIEQAVSSQGFERGIGIETCDDDEEEEPVLRTFTVHSDMVEKLKRIVTSRLGGISCTSFEVVAAHLWKVLSPLPPTHKMYKFTTELFG